MSMLRVAELSGVLEVLDQWLIYWQGQSLIHLPSADYLGLGRQMKLRFNKHWGNQSRGSANRGLAQKAPIGPKRLVQGHSLLSPCD